MPPASQESNENRSKMDNQSPIKVVISGMSGLYPQSSNMKEFSDLLYNKVDPISHNPKILNNIYPEIPQHLGEVPDLENFDAQFFKVHRRLGLVMDPMSRKLFEHTYQALYDAGLSVEHVSGKNIGVFVGNGLSEAEKVYTFNMNFANSSTITGISKAMFANRISYWLNVNGPSLTIDNMCCSSIVALEQAFLAIQRGDCEAAIVASCSITIHPQTVINYGRNIHLSPDGKTRSFDNDGQGCVKSGGGNVLFLQKAEDALRVYAEILSAKTAFSHCGQKTDPGNMYFHRSPEQLITFLHNFYEDTCVPPQKVEYVEAFGAATPEVDKAELEAFDNVFCKNRDHNKPLLVGNVMSNIGYCEAASGIASINKVLLAYETGLVAANLHCLNPRKDVSAIRDGRIQIVTEHQPISGPYMAVNNLSITDLNGHVLLRGHNKKKVSNQYKSSIPHLVAISGRQESCVIKIFDDLKSRPLDPEELALLRHIHEKRISAHLARGFSILDTDENNETVSIYKEVEYFDDIKRPVWFVYSGMGSQWVGMGAQLMRIPIFSAAIERCKKVLEPKGLDIVHIITSSDKSMFDNILHSFVGIAAIQIGLTDILRELGIEPDNIIGHSVGELGCGYADGCLTTEEMILSAYSRGLVSLQTPFIKGSMAAVGIGYQKVVGLCPPEIDVACHNGPESSTISGPAEAMQQFVHQLTAQGIFAKEVPSSNIAFHSRYIAKAGPKLLEYLSEIIKTPKPRSDRWISTSIPQENLGLENSKYCSAWYHTNNLLSPVLFEEMTKIVPDNAIVIEIAPHGLLQAILKRSLSPDCQHVPLTKRGHPDNTTFLLEAVGKLYMYGLSPKLNILYPKIDFPVSTGTPMLSHQVEWIHAETWGLPLYQNMNLQMTSVRNSVISIHDDENTYLKGYIVNGKTLFPFSAALIAVWETFAMSSGIPKNQVSVQFQDIHLFAEPPIHDLRTLKIFVDLHKGSGKFEVTNGFSKVVTGYIRKLESGEEKVIAPLEANASLIYDKEYIYGLLEEKRYSFAGEFQAIKKTNYDFTNALLEWNKNWVTFIDGMLQLAILNRDHDSVSRPSHIHKITIDLRTHFDKQVANNDNGTLIAMLSTVPKNYICSGGVAIEKIEFYDMPTHTENNMLLMGSIFIPRSKHGLTELDSSLHVYIQMVTENLGRQKLKVIEIVENYNIILRNNKKAFNNLPDISIEYITINKQDLGSKVYDLSADIILLQNLSSDEMVLAQLRKTLKPNSYIINREKQKNDENVLIEDYHIICKHSTNHERLELGKWRFFYDASPFTTIVLKDKMEFQQFCNNMNKIIPNNKTLVVSPYPMPGLKDILLQYRKKTNREDIFLILHSDGQNIDWSSLKIDTPFNIFKNGQWGGEYYVPCLENIAASYGITLQSGRVGDLNSLHWEEVSEPSNPGISVTVRYFAINYIDATRAIGTIPVIKNNDYKLSYGMDFSGTTTSGERVMGIVSNGAAKGRVQAIPELLWPVPEHWTLEDAATVPLAYAQAFYCLGIRAKLHSGMTVLVHGAAGALGQAVLTIAIAYNCKVFATVSSTRKKNFLLKCFPDLEGCIGNSRDHTFGDLVMQATDGVGCDIIMSCVTGDLKNTTLGCLAYNGIMFDTIQVHLNDDFTYGLFYLSNQTSYTMINFYDIFKNKEDMKCLQTMIGEGISRGYIQPISRITYAAHEVPKAFRLVAASRHFGRVLIRLRDCVLATQPRLTCSPKMHQLIICDNNRVGLHLAKRLMARGANRIHWICPSSLSEHVVHQLQSWQKLGVSVTTSSEVIRSEKSFENLGYYFDIRNIEGIFIVDVDDNLTSMLSNLNSASKKYCAFLKYFACVGTPKSLYQIDEECQLNKSSLKLISDCKLAGEKNYDQASLISKFDAIERAIRSTKRMFKMYPQKIFQLPLLHQIADISGITIPETVKEESTVKELGFDCTLSNSICTFLENVHNVSLLQKEVSDLTVKMIQDLESKINEPFLDRKPGLASFISYIDSDEIEATSEFIILPTLDKEATQEKFYIDKQYLYIIPGLEGNYARFKDMCEQLKVPAAVLQPGYDHPHDTVQEMAQRYAQVLKKKTFLKDKFYIMGFESGISIALELVAILENEGLVGTVFCFGGTPDEIQAYFLENIRDFKSEEDLQDEFLSHVAGVILGEVTSDIKENLKTSSSWESKCDLIVNEILNGKSHSIQFIQSYIEATYKRMKAMIQHHLQIRQLKSKIVWIRSASTSEITPDEVLQSYSLQPISKYKLRAPLEHSFQDPRCAAIVNRHLSADILHEFETKSNCEMFLDISEIFAIN